MAGEIVGVPAHQLGAGDFEGRRRHRADPQSAGPAPAARTDRACRLTQQQHENVSRRRPGVKWVNGQASAWRQAQDLGEVVGAGRRSWQPHDLVRDVVFDEVLMDVEWTQHVDLRRHQNRPDSMLGAGNPGGMECLKLQKTCGRCEVAINLTRESSCRFRVRQEFVGGYRPSAEQLVNGRVGTCVRLAPVSHSESTPPPSAEAPGATERRATARAGAMLAAIPVADELGELFAHAGHDLALVGGSVRDALLGPHQSRSRLRHQRATRRDLAHHQAVAREPMGNRHRLRHRRLARSMAIGSKSPPIDSRATTRSRASPR